MVCSFTEAGERADESDLWRVARSSANDEVEGHHAIAKLLAASCEHAQQGTHIRLHVRAALHSAHVHQHQRIGATKSEAEECWHRAEHCSMSLHIADAGAGFGEQRAGGGEPCGSPRGVERCGVVKGRTWSGACERAAGAHGAVPEGHPSRQ